MKKNKNLFKINKFFINGIKGFILATIPILIIELEAMISERYSFSFMYKIISDVFAYGILGIIIATIYTYSSKYYPKISKYTTLLLIIGYYVVAFIFFIAGIYFDMIGPLFK